VAFFYQLSTFSRATGCMAVVAMMVVMVVGVVEVVRLGVWW